MPTPLITGLLALLGAKSRVVNSFMGTLTLQTFQWRYKRVCMTVDGQENTPVLGISCLKGHSAPRLHSPLTKKEQMWGAFLL